MLFEHFAIGALIGFISTLIGILIGLCIQIGGCRDRTTP